MILIEMTVPKISIRDIAYIAVFTALMAVCSWISIPTAIPFTLQTMGVFLAVGLLGGKRGTLAVTAYVDWDRLPIRCSCLVINCRDRTSTRLSVSSRI